MMSEAQAADKPILVEGANALMLDIDHGYVIRYPKSRSETDNFQNLPLCHQLVDLDRRCYFRSRHQSSQDKGNNRRSQSVHHPVGCRKRTLLFRNC